MRGDWPFVPPPSNALFHAHFGAEPPVFGKIVYGLPGDIVTHRGADVVVSWAAGAGHEAPSEQLVAKLKPVSSAGDKLEPGQTRSAERRAGQQCVRPVRSPRCTRHPKKNKQKQSTSS